MTDNTAQSFAGKHVIMSEGRCRLFAAAGTLALYSVVLAVCGLIRYGWTLEWFWNSGSQAIVFLLLGAGSLTAGGFAYRGKVAEQLEPDAHDRSRADRSDAIAAKITFIICINLCVNMFTIAQLFDVAWLQYLAWGLALPCVLYVVISIVTKNLLRQTKDTEKP